ncbi:toxin-antitoxin system HicB family antitoxin [Methylomonas sp. Kb3]|uniref:YlcI/YnfO family protein n=1 Tax=Methylomonas sp. Kb3 TaxID=1611544 RepID=UPI000C326005|nr:YlcI/YnfO family protein [Methylomonas sp. Kb3]PKD38242.1 toxin-antitoxin system HicB family antitoxin [Methylomonas sp. Kb3]
MSSNTSTYPLRLPRSVKAAVEKLAKEEGVSLNQFVATAVAEKLAAMNTAAFFSERKNRADFDAFKKILTREGGQPPRTGDELPIS